MYTQYLVYLYMRYNQHPLGCISKDNISHSNQILANHKGSDGFRLTPIICNIFVVIFFVLNTSSAMANLPSCRTVVSQLVGGAAGWVSSPGAVRVGSAKLPPGTYALVPGTQKAANIQCQASPDDRSEAVGYIWSAGLQTSDTDVKSITIHQGSTTIEGYVRGFRNGLFFDSMDWTAPTVVLSCRELKTGHVASATYPTDSMFTPPMGGMLFLRCPGVGARDVEISSYISPFQGVSNATQGGNRTNNHHTYCHLNSPNSADYKNMNTGPLPCGGMIVVGDGSNGPQGLLQNASDDNTKLSEKYWFWLTRCLSSYSM